MRDCAPRDESARELLLRSMDWMDPFWDEPVGLLWSPGELYVPRAVIHADGHMVRETVWYALGLLLRNRKGDTARAVRAIRTILRTQFDEPDQPFHGTFYRSPEEPHPPAIALAWKHYDPNWREFIMTTLAVILIEYGARLDRSLRAALDATLRRAVAGALVRPLEPTYTNIALMNAFLLVFAGDRLNEPSWIVRGEAMGAGVERLFKRHSTFEEYNSPTYYGVDLYALALWRSYSSSPCLRRAGAEMEAALWRDIARYYHAGLRNIAGPYDRAYGMDMLRYAAVVGEWIWLLTGEARAPFPDTRQPFAHAADFCFAPPVALLGARVPADALPHLLSFQGERLVEQTISDEPRRVASAWLSEEVMIGGERRGRTEVKGDPAQYHPATIHWAVAPGVVGWIRLRSALPVDAQTTRGRLEMLGNDALTFAIDAAGIGPGALEAARWCLPGLAVEVETDAGAVETSACAGLSWIRYHPGQ